MPTTTTHSRDGNDARPARPVPPALHPVVFRRPRRPYVRRQPHRWPLLLHAAAPAQYVPPPPRSSRLQPFAATRPTRVPPAFRAPPPRTHPPLRLDGLLPPTGFPMLGPHPRHIRPTPTYRDAPQLTPSSPPTHRILHGPIRGAWPPSRRLATPPRVSLLHHASRCPTTRLAAPPRISGHHYASRPATTHVVTTPTTRASPSMLLANPLPPTTRPALLHTLLWPLSCVLALRFHRLRSHLRGVRRH